MKKQRPMKRLLARSAVMLTAASLLTIPFSLPAFAGKEGVFINSSVYFTLDKVTLSAGAEDGSLRFTLGLNNDGENTVDFNRYGVKVVDENGVSYTAKLSEKVSGQVKAHETGSFSFLSSVPSDLTPGQLKVDIFRWDYNAMTDVGALSVEAAMEEGQTVSQQAVINLQELDSTLPDDAQITASLGGSYRVFKDGAWNVFTDLILENLGNTTLKLPDALEYNFKDNKGLTYGAQLTNGSGASLLPQQHVKVTLQGVVPSSLETKDLSLLFSPKGGVQTTVLGSLNLTSSFDSGKIGDSKTYPNTDTNGLTINTAWAAASKQSDGLHLQANVTLTNNSSEIVAIPDLSAEFQAVKGGVSVASADSSVRTDYLSPNESTTFRFSGTLPVGLNTDSLQLVVMEKKASSSTSSSSSSQQSSGQTEQSSASTAKQAAWPVMITALAGVGSGGEVTPYSAAESYVIGSPLPLLSNNLIDDNMDVSLVEMNLHENTDFGYKTVIAKYKLRNKGTTTLTIPEFQTDLVSGMGYTYSGARQTSVAKELAPNTSYIVSYSYMLPGDESGDQLAMNIYDANRMTIGSYKTKLQQVPEEGPVSLYPFSIDVKDYSVSATYNKDSSYAYRLRLDMDVTRLDQSIVDANFSKLGFEVVDVTGRVLSSQTMNFTGEGKVMSGIQFIDFGNIKSQQLNDDVTINMFELIDTPNGQVKRLVKELKM
ncbi:hypothetical protein [Paenibacillus hexagrammi]|uniref:Uncharacterized protein n=1 Tax=Paenibacillus hexagrammi TaxID=2908839 RepID=A0ABY3SQS5_9BACL|nr:hypothetical protein [Paenibacillus sp. YPD9-1]UJF36034.1 hypothetical protein L0M14_13725 [Paenibacillus sp. YPD9-1]